MEVMEENLSDNEGPPKKRGRKKQLYKNILSLMEFYFSASSLSKDRWLSRKLKEEGEIHLTEFMKFNKIRALTQDMNDIVKALRKSEVLALTEDMKVKRIKPVKFKENEDDYIIYIEQIPSDADHEWLSSIFSKFGQIDYISIPRFKNSNKCKGFAFVEFEEKESAEKAIADYKKNGNYLSTDIEPSELMSIATYEERKVDEPETCEPNTVAEKFDVTNEIDVDENDQPLFETKEASTNENEKIAKKRKVSNTSNEIQLKKPKVEIIEGKLENQEEHNLEQKEVTADESEKDDDNIACSEGIIDESKKKKNRKKKSKKKKNNDDTESTSLQILSKKDWKRLRNKYLNIQKERMKQLKKHIFLAKKKDETCKYNAFKRKEKPPMLQESHNNGGGNKAINKDTFIPGLIVKVKFDEPITDVKELKSEMKKNDGVQFVDVKEGENVIHLRFDCTEKASEFCKISAWPKTKLLKGEKEEEYWKIIKELREGKLTKNTKKKERGKDKLMRKAENILGKHITFD